MKLSTRTIVAIGIGAAVSCSKPVCLNSKRNSNTLDHTAYAFLAFMAVIFDQSQEL